MLNEVKAFSEKFAIPTNAALGFLPDDQMKNRLDFQLEELLETAHAAGFFFDSAQMEFRTSAAMIETRNLAEVLDGLIDQVYVALGTAIALGFCQGEDEAPAREGGRRASPWSIGWARVHNANMQKVATPGEWKIDKPAGWERPYLGDLVK